MSGFFILDAMATYALEEGYFIIAWAPPPGRMLRMSRVRFCKIEIPHQVLVILEIR